MSRFTTAARLGAALLFLPLLPTSASAQAGSPFQVSGSLRVDGGSTVRSWSCDAKTLQARVTSAPGATLQIAQLGNAVRTVELDVPVNRLDCDNDTMNDHMWTALDSKKHEMIRFRMQSYAVTQGAGGAATLSLRGNLEIHGQTRAVTLTAQARQDGSALVVSGMHELDMTEWGVRPPRLMLGTLRVHEKVQVHFDLRLTTTAEATNSTASGPTPESLR
jgi:polyisoprenoid-binding protein YceI